MDDLYYAKIPRKALGQVLPEERIKSVLQRLNPGISFDLGGRHNIRHPEIDFCQSVYFDEGQRHICTMDRGWMLDGMISEVPVWATNPDLVEVGTDELTLDEIAGKSILIPSVGSATRCWVKRQVRGDLLLCGWRDTFRRIAGARIPGVTPEVLSREFLFDWRDYVEPADESEVQGEQTDPWDDHYNQEREGQAAAAMGVYQARPTIVLTDAP